MFVDASAAIAIIADEPDGPALAARLGQAGAVFTSPLAYFETVAGLARNKSVTLEEAAEIADDFLREIDAAIVDVDAAIGRRAVATSAAYGKGRHPAALNMGDCFAYACARAIGVPLLFKGNDFLRTDIEVG
jgi:ribonuclease VapC